MPLEPPPNTNSFLHYAESGPTQLLRYPLCEVLLNELTQRVPHGQASAAWQSVLSQLLSGATVSALETVLRQGCKAASAASARPWSTAHEHFVRRFAEAATIEGMQPKEHQAAALLMELHQGELAELFPNVFFAYKGVASS